MTRTYKLEFELTYDELQSLSNGLAPWKMIEHAQKILGIQKDINHRYYKFSIRQGDESYLALMKVFNVWVEKYTLAQLVDAVLINWCEHESLVSEPANRDEFWFELDDGLILIAVRSYGAPEEITLPEFMRLSQDLTAYEPNEIDIKRAIHYRNGDRPERWHWDFMPETYSENEEVDDDRYYAARYQIVGQDGIKTVLFPMQEVHWDLSEPEDWEVLDVLKDLWRSFAAVQLVDNIQVKDPIFDLDDLYDAFGNVIEEE